MFMVCDECKRLWGELGDATAIAIRLDNKLKLAALQHNYEKMKILAPQTKAAFVVRDQAREKVRLHEAAEHQSR